MGVAIQPASKYHSANDLERLSEQGYRYELVQGILREMAPSGGSHGSATSRLAYQVQQHIYENDLGECFTSEVGVFLARNPDTVLAPDFAFIASARLPAQIPPGYLAIIPDLLFETRSPGDTKREIEAKMEQWITAGVRLAWDIDPKSQSVVVYRPGEQAVTLGIDDALEGGDVLPGFAMPIRKIFRETATR